MTTMKNYKRLLSSMLAVLVLVVFNSCEDDSELFERYRLEHYPNMPKPLFDIYYENL